VVSQEDTSAQALAPLDSIKSISIYSLIGAVSAGAVIILLTMLMIVRERRREIGVMKAIGAQNAKITAQFMVEAITFTLMGAGLGLVIGLIAGNPVTKMLVTNSVAAASNNTAPVPGFGRALRQAGTSLTNIQTTIGWDILLWGLIAAIVIAIVGSAIPAWLISKVRPADVMRAE
jgi:putative ABC transport system permease protein